MKLNDEEYRSKVLGCWMGKNIGGTLGAPMEWRRQINDVDFYTQDLSGDPLPNDDLDIQLLWLIAMEEQGVVVDSKLLAHYWLTYVTPHWAEYGNTKANQKLGIMPPLAGWFNNDFKDSCGAYIRGEIWACIAPGQPALAGELCFEDGSIDHGGGEGAIAEVFITSLEAAAFVESDINKLIDIGLSHIPEESGVARAVRFVRELHAKNTPYLAVRDEVLRNFRGGFFFHPSQHDVEMGFDNGPYGWDAPDNIAMIIIGLLYGEGDFDKTICYTVNCGEDTDCTAATVGSIWGIINGIEGIPQRWIDPIGTKIVTACINIGDLGMYENAIPKDVYNLTERTIKLCKELTLRKKLDLQIGDFTTDAGEAKKKLLADSRFLRLYDKSRGAYYSFPFFNVRVEYEDMDASISVGQTKEIRLVIENKYRVQEYLNIKWYLCEGFELSPETEGVVFLSRSGDRQNERILTYALTAVQLNRSVNRFVIECSVVGKSDVMLIPVLLVNKLL